MITLKTGAETLIESKLDRLHYKNIGIITNHTSVVRFENGGTEHLVDYLHRQPDITIKGLFSPEHGLRGDVPPGQHVEHGVDTRTGIPIYSLYGKNKKPTPEMLEDIDVLLYDIQDVGVRFYTFISTLAYTMEAAALHGIKYFLLDRPNMLSNRIVEGPLLSDSLRSFVGALPIPVVYGMTPGELALMVNNEKWLQGGIAADLEVVPILNYNRSIWYDETGLDWVNPSPNVRSMDAVITYPGIALLEGTNISEGRGTDSPFLLVGAPFINGASLEKYLRSQNHPGIGFEKTVFVPEASRQPKGAPKYSNMRCDGVRLIVEDRESLRPIELGLSIIAAIHALYPDKLRFREPWFDRLIGTESVRSLIMKGLNATEISSTWMEETHYFKMNSEKYYLYQNSKPHYIPDSTLTK